MKDPRHLPRLELKELAVLDQTELLKILSIRNQPAVRNNMYTDHEITPEEHDRWIRRMVPSQNCKFFAVVQDGEILGGASLTNICFIHKRADWAFYLSKACQGRGIGADLEYKFITTAFRDFELEKLNCEVISFNSKVIQIHQKFGFKIEGNRRHHVVRDGVWYDAILLGITKEEWEAKFGAVDAP